ncbi:hypothetical protein II906_07750 [bacterium]|nr:hypothetical protein [bacterium]
MSKIIFWLVVIAIIVYAVQSNMFSGASYLINGIKSDVKHQKESVIERDDIDLEALGMQDVEKTRKTGRRSGLGAAVTGGR